MQGMVEASREVNKLDAFYTSTPLRLAALGVVLAFLGFIKTTEQMLQGDMRGFDEWLLQGLRRPENPRFLSVRDGSGRW